MSKFTDGTERPVVYKKRAAPRPPQDHNYESEKSAWMNKKVQAPDPILKSVMRPPKSDPIRELEKMGRKSSDEVFFDFFL
jgi:hypothetical protein